VKKRLVISLILVLLATLGFTAQPASADDGSTVLKIIEQVAPGILKETVDDPSRLVSRIEGAGGSALVKLIAKAPDASKNVSLAVNYVRRTLQSSKGLTILSGDDPSTFALTQSTKYGFRILTALTAAPLTNRFDYTFDLPVTVTLQMTATGYLVVNGDSVLGAISKPWAMDSNGQRLATHFEWQNRVLTQVLDEDLSRISYPVILDPAWGYTKQYPLKYSPEVNFAKLQTCFNCYFPVPGAPYAYPRIGQLLPLTIVGVNFECTMGPTYQFPGYREFQFNATKNHIDGYGSSISFQMTRVGSGYALIVQGYIVRDFTPGGNAIYVAGAWSMWQLFADNLNVPTVNV
jgi:hypothetical protein